MAASINGPLDVDLKVAAVGEEEPPELPHETEAKEFREADARVKAILEKDGYDPYEVAYDVVRLQDEAAVAVETSLRIMAAALGVEPHEVPLAEGSSPVEIVQRERMKLLAQIASVSKTWQEVAEEAREGRRLAEAERRAKALLDLMEVTSDGTPIETLMELARRLYQAQQGSKAQVDRDHAVLLPLIGLLREHGFIQ